MLKVPRGASSLLRTTMPRRPNPGAYGYLTEIGEVIASRWARPGTEQAPTHPSCRIGNSRRGTTASHRPEPPEGPGETAGPRCAEAFYRWVTFGGSGVTRLPRST